MKTLKQESNIRLHIFEKCHFAVENGLNEVKKRPEKTG